MRVTVYFVLAAVALGVAACSTTPANLEAKTQPTSRAFIENYQEIYRRVFNTATRCVAGNVGSTSSFEVDGQLYSELGFGEVMHSTVTLGRNYIWKVKIERKGDGSLMTVNAGNTLVNDTWIAKLFRWAGGDETC